MEIWQALVLAIIEGVTEFLPISSTGHLILAGRFLGMTTTEFVKSFEVFIQLGAIGAVAGLYGQRLAANRKLLMKLGVAFLPTGIVGMGLYPLIKGFFLESAELTLAALAVGGLVIIGIEKTIGKKPGRETWENWGFGKLLLVGLVQALAVIPGVSRAAATILGGMVLGLSREEAVELSFLLAIPTMAAATGWDLIQSSWGFSGREWLLLTIGFGAAFVSARVVVKWLLGYARKNDFTGFGIYRIIAGGLGLIALWRL